MQQMLDQIRQTFSVQDARLTKKQMSILKYISDHLDESCYLSLRQLCENIGCSQVTLLRLCRELGFESFVAFREAIRKKRAELYREDPAPAQDPMPALFETVIKNEKALFEQFFAQLDAGEIDRCAKRMTEADFVLIIGRRISGSVGQILSMRLSQCSIENTVVDPVSDAKRLRQLLGLITARSVVIAISYPIYTPEQSEAVRQANLSGAYSIAITDSPNAPISALASSTLLCPRSLDNVYNSFITPVEMINLLAHSIVIRMGLTYRSLVDDFDD